MKRSWILSGCPFLLVVWLRTLVQRRLRFRYGVASGTYYLAENGETSTLVLKPDHSFQQELTEHGEVKRAAGTWHRIGEGGIEFSKEFLLVPGQEPDADGSAYADIHKNFGLFVSLSLRQYQMLWYGRVDPSPSNTVSGTYAGDEPGVSATLTLKPDHTFEQAIHTP